MELTGGKKIYRRDQINSWRSLFGSLSWSLRLCRCNLLQRQGGNLVTITQTQLMYLRHWLSLTTWLHGTSSSQCYCCKTETVQLKETEPVFPTTFKSRTHAVARRFLLLLKTGNNGPQDSCSQGVFLVLLCCYGRVTEWVKEWATL